MVLANILAETIIELAPGLAGSLAADGRLIVSGIIRDRTDAVVERLTACGLPRMERHQDGDWVALLAQR
jgi:ribosomal protein L11 methyltransferase